VHGKVGHLFQGRYRAIVCETDEYLVTLVRYIHLKPVRLPRRVESNDRLAADMARAGRDV